MLYGRAYLPARAHDVRMPQAKLHPQAPNVLAILLADGEEIGPAASAVLPQD